MRHFRYLPRGLQGVCLALALSPLVAAGVGAWQISALRALPLWWLPLVAIFYVFMPWALVALLLGRRPAFLHALIGECIGLLGVASLATGALPQPLMVVHYADAMTMVVLALMLVNRDRLFPFLFPGPRGFRRAPRVAVNQRIKVEAPLLNLTIDAMIEDLSESGLAIYGGESTLDELLVAVRRGEPLVVRCSVQKERFVVPVSYLWQARLSEVARLGARARDEKAMAALFAALAPQAARGKILRRVVSYALAASLLAVMILPPLIRAFPRATAQETHGP